MRLRQQLTQSQKFQLSQELACFEIMNSPGPGGGSDDSGVLNMMFGTDYGLRLDAEPSAPPKYKASSLSKQLIFNRFCEEALGADPGNVIMEC